MSKRPRKSAPRDIDLEIERIHPVAHEQRTIHVREPLGALRRSRCTTAE